MSKRILIFSTAYMPFIGGAEVAVKEITDRIKDIEFDMITVNLDHKQKKFERIGNVNVYRLGSKKFFPLMALIKAISLNLTRRYDLIWSVMASYAGFAALFFSYLHPRKPFVLSLQEGDSKEELQRKFQFVWPLFRKVIDRPDLVQTISKYLADFAASVRTEDNIIIIPNGVDVSYFARPVSPKNIKKENNEVFLITISRLVKKNAVRDIIASLGFLPNNFKLLIVGNGELLEDLKIGARDVGVADRVLFIGEVKHSDILPYLKAADIFIRPSLSEGFGNSFVEAMAAKFPVIASPVGGIVDFIFDPNINKNEKPTGVFCQVRNPKSIAEKVEFLIDNPKIRQKIIDNAYEMVLEKYDWNVISEKMRKSVFDPFLT